MQRKLLLRRFDQLLDMRFRRKVYKASFRSSNGAGNSWLLCFSQRYSLQCVRLDLHVIEAKSLGLPTSIVSRSSTAPAMLDTLQPRYFFVSATAKRKFPFALSKTYYQPSSMCDDPM